MTQRGLMIRNLPLVQDGNILYLILNCGMSTCCYRPDLIAVPLISARATKEQEGNGKSEDFTLPRWCTPILVPTKFLATAENSSLLILRSSDSVETLRKRPLALKDQSFASLLKGEWRLLGSYPPQPVRYMERFFSFDDYDKPSEKDFPDQPLNWSMIILHIDTEAGAYLLQFNYRMRDPLPYQQNPVAIDCRLFNFERDTSLGQFIGPAKLTELSDAFAEVPFAVRPAAKDFPLDDKRSSWLEAQWGETGMENYGEVFTYLDLAICHV